MMIHGVGRQEKYSGREQSCTPRNRTAGKPKPGPDVPDFTRGTQIC